MIPGAENLVGFGVVSGVLLTIKAFDLWHGKRNGNGNGKHKQSIECALDHKALASTFASLAETAKRQQALAEKMGVTLDRIDRWHAEEIPGQPGQKKIWADINEATQTANRNIRLLCRKQGVVYVED